MKKLLLTFVSVAMVSFAAYSSLQWILYICKEGGTMKRNMWILGMGLAMLLGSCGQPDTKEYLKKVIEKMETIESANYHNRLANWLYGKDLVYDVVYLVQEYNNPKDTTIGACFVNRNTDPYMRFEGAYDGNVQLTTYHDKHGVVEDDFSERELPRSVAPPFFNLTKSIIKYTIETTDSIEISFVDEDSCYHLKLTILEDRQVGFFGKPYYFPKPSVEYATDPTTIHEIWFRKSEDLPYKYYKSREDYTFLSECLQPEFNTLSLANLNIYDYIPEDYEVRRYRPRDSKKQTEKVYALQGKPAPEWTLNDIHDNPVSLADIKSKVVLLNFTGIGCGACQAAIPFLKELKAKYSPEDFELIAIESWSNRTASRRGYSEKKELNYLFLGANEEVLKDYQTGRAAPWFFLLDENHIVRKVFYGYSVERTGKEIEEAIENLIN